MRISCLLQGVRLEANLHAAGEFFNILQTICKIFKPNLNLLALCNDAIISDVLIIFIQSRPQKLISRQFYFLLNY